MLKPFTRPFTDHPASVDETYGEHLLFAGRFGTTLILAGLAALLHGLFPFLFERTASRTVIALADGCSSRTKRSEDGKRRMTAAEAALR